MKIIIVTRRLIRYSGSSLVKSKPEIIIKDRFSKVPKKKATTKNTFKKIENSTFSSNT
jgi:hypothetical protein